MLRSTSEMAFTVWGSSSKVYDYALRTIPRLIYTAHLHVLLLSSCNWANKLLCGLWGQNVQLQKQLSACKQCLCRPSTAVNWSDATPFPSYLPIHYHVLKMLLPLYGKERNACSQLHCSNFQAKISVQTYLQPGLKSNQRTELDGQSISIPTLTPTLHPGRQCSLDWKNSWE